MDRYGGGRWRGTRVGRGFRRAADAAPAAPERLAICRIQRRWFPADHRRYKGAAVVLGPASGFAPDRGPSPAVATLDRIPKLGVEVAQRPQTGGTPVRLEEAARGLFQ